MLGRVDGFDQDDGEDEFDESGETLGGFLATQGNPLEALQLADQLLDPGAGFVELLREERRSFLGVLPVWDDRCNTARTAGGAVGGCIVALVGDRRTRRDVGANVEQRFKLGAVADLSAGQMESNGLAVEIRLDVDLAGKSAA